MEGLCTDDKKNGILVRGGEFIEGAGPVVLSELVRLLDAVDLGEEGERLVVGVEGVRERELRVVEDEDCDNEGRVVRVRATGDAGPVRLAERVITFPRLVADFTVFTT